MKAFYNTLKLNKITLLTILLSLFVITFYQYVYNQDTKIISYNISQVFIFCILNNIIGVFLASLRNRKFYLKYIYGVIWGLFLTILLLLYTLSFFGHKILGTPISLKIMWIYFTQFNTTIDALNISPWFAYPLLLCIPVFITIFVIVKSEIMWSNLIKQKIQFIEFFRSSRFIKIKISTGLLFISFLYFAIQKFSWITLYKRLEVSREPFFLIFSNNTIGGISFTDNQESPAIRKGYPKNLVFNKKNVVIIMIDALRADYLSMYGYPEITSPFLSKLYKTGTLRKVDYVFSASSISFAGILGTLQSKFWTNMSLKGFSLQDLLKDQGYRVNFILSGDHTNFLGLKSCYGNSLDFYFDGTSTKNYYVNDDSLLFEGLDKVPNYNNNPAFFYFHLMSVHSLGIRHKEYIKYLPANVSPSDKISYQNNYKNGILQADSYIKLLFERLKNKGYLKNSIIVITADHGESLGENGIFMHSNNVSSKETYIPLLIYDEDKTTTYRGDHARQSDIAATIVDRLSLPIPPSWEGESLLKKSNDPFSFHFIRSSYAIINYKDDKMLKYCYDSDTKKEELFELKSDINETNNLLPYIDHKTLEEFRDHMKKIVKATDSKKKVF
jgi:glucan phosphoethanolaminetransferase (alkaline phosphatase superfamily)